jgi:GT2 family glycosyltransferase/glycosyltransferase involved in cell wall biosynthesis/tetratricopeptide (TPR) repeat protein
MPIFLTRLDILLFAHVPKCAGQSISSYLCERFGEPALTDNAFLDMPYNRRWSRTSPQHIPAEVLRRLFPQGFFSASFAFVRDPAARIESVFHYQRDKERLIAPEVRFEDWVMGLPELVGADPWAFDGHVAPMACAVPDDARVFRLEDGFVAFTDWLDSRYGASELRVPMLNTRTASREHAPLSERARAVVEDVYAEDYQRFGYAKQTAQPAVSASRQRAEVLLDLGLARFQRNEPWVARRLFDLALEADPTNPVTLSITSVTESMAGNSDLAATRATAALAQDSRLLDAHLVRVRTCLEREALDEAEAALTEARRILGDLPSLDLFAAMLSARRGESELALAVCASAVARAIADGATVLQDEARVVWRRLLSDARASGTSLPDLIHDLALRPGVPGQADARPTGEVVILRLGDDGLQSGPDLVDRLLARLRSASGATAVVLVRAGDRVQPESITALVAERARTGWAALGTALLNEPDLFGSEPASKPLRAAITKVFAATCAPCPLPMLVGGAVALAAKTAVAALERLDVPLTDFDDIIPAVTLSLTDAGLGVASWAGAIAEMPDLDRSNRAETLIADAALLRLCRREGDLRALLAVELVASDRVARRLGVALAAAGLPDRPRLLAAMVRHDSADLPIALRASAFAALWPRDTATATEALAALERGFDKPALLPFALQTSDTPVVSIIIPAHNQIGATYSTLSALRLQGETPPFEVILVDDGSSDATRTLETVVSGLRVLRNQTPQRFIAACNAGASVARGEFLCFLNNDTEPTPGWLSAMLAACRMGAGLAGARLILPDGRLQEAGGLLDNAANPANFGSGGHPLDPRFAYRREADYLSGAALMIPHEVWERVGGFSTYLEGMYFEDTDLACKVHATGLPVVYVSAAIVIHHEGTTSGRDVKTGPKALQEVNRPRFRDRWATFLSNYPSPDMPFDLRADHRAKGRILFVDFSVPRPDHDAGGHASFEEMRMMIALGWKVTFIDAAAAYLPGYVEALQDIGVEVLHAPFVSSPEEAIKARGADFDLIYVSRYWLARRLIPLLRAINPAARAVVNVADLHFLREMREARLNGDPAALDAARALRREEIAALSLADLVLCYSATETAILWEASDGQIEARLCPWVEEVACTVPPATERAGLSFLGGFAHPPNLHGVRWFVSEVLPLLPAAALDVYGSEAGPEVQALATAQVRVRGFAHDVSDCFARYRVFVAPLLAGAGVKGKVIKALCHGIPCVLTPVAAEGLGLVHGVHALIVESPVDWAAAIDRLLSDDALWSDMSQAALDHARRQYGHDAGVRAMAALLDGVLRPTLPKAAPSEPAAPALATFDDAAQRLTLHFEVQHHGAPDPALWLADLLADPRHSLHLSLDGDEDALATGRAAAHGLRAGFAHFGLTRSPHLRWGGPSIHLALIDRLRQSLSISGWDYLVNLSGTCAPLQPLDALKAHLSEAHGRGIRAHCFSFPIEDGPRLPLQRTDGPMIRGRAGRAELRGPAALLDWFRDPGRNPIVNPNNRLFVHVSEPEGERHLLDIRPLTAAEFALRRRLFSQIVPHVGRAWYALHRSVVEALVHYLDSPRASGLVAATLPGVFPEEMIIQTILANGLIADTAQVQRMNLHRDNAAPVVYTDADAGSVLRQDGSFFLRKLDPVKAPLIRRVLADRLRGGKGRMDRASQPRDPFPLDGA